MAGDLTFFELGVEDAERGRAFYEGLFGWRFAPGPSGEGFMIETPERAAAGSTAATAAPRPTSSSPWTTSRRRMERVRELGGVVEEMDVEGDEDSQRGPGASSSAATTRARPSGCTSRRPADGGPTPGRSSGSGTSCGGAPCGPVPGRERLAVAPGVLAVPPSASITTARARG